MKKISKVFAAVCILLFSLFAVLTPAVFAQAPASTSTDKTLQAQQYIDLIDSIFNFVLQQYVEEVDPEILYKGAVSGMLDSLGDEHSQYLEPSNQRNMNDITSGTFGGVGLTITKPTVSTEADPAYVEVTEPVYGGPGWRAGIEAGDLIVEIDDVATPDISMDDVLDMLRGTIGEPVTVKIRRGRTMEFKVTLIRELIEVPTVKYGVIADNGRRTGYLRIIKFTQLTAQRVQDALDSFLLDGIDSLIIDVRGNPGGLLTSGVAVADKFISEGVIVSQKGRIESENHSWMASKEGTTFPDTIPIVILEDANSASCSEILLGALKDTKRAYIVGERSYGKGSVQKPIGLPYGDGFKLTVQKYYSPSDSNIHKVGIPPDQEVLFPTLSMEEQEAYVRLMNDAVISAYVEEHQDMDEADIARYADQLSEDYAPLSAWLLRRIVRLSVNRTRGDPLYDMDYDIQLQAAVETVRSPDIWNLINSTSTLKELEEAAKAAAED